MNLRSLDLNLLVVFDAVMETRNTRRAGEKVGLSQPAVSNALARLRGHLKDELFLRGAGGLRPTDRAAELAGPIRQVLHELETVLDTAAFDPTSAVRTFRIGTNDYVVTVLLPALMARLETVAPGVDVRILPSAGRSLEMLDARELDLAIAAFTSVPDRFGSRSLLEDAYACLMRADHPLATEGMLTLDTYAAARHLLVTPRGEDTGFIDTALAKLGRTRRIALTINSFSSAAPVLVETDLIVTLPRAIACSFCRDRDMAIRAVPFEHPDDFGRPAMIWHRKLGHHPAGEWFRKFVSEVAADVQATL